MSNLELRKPNSDDAESIGTIIYNAFKTISSKHNFPEDFPSVDAGIGLARMMIDRPDIYGVAAEIDGNLAGSNFLWEGDEVDGVGPITVDPAAQNSSVGKRLMLDVLRRSEQNGKRSIRLLQAAYHNRSLALYTKLGFDTVEPLSLINGDPVTAEISGHTIRPMTEADIANADAVCVAVHGISRKNEIAGAVAQGSALVVENDGKIVGYSTVIGFFGHAVSTTNDGLKALIGSEVQIAGPGMLVPTRNNDLMRWCLSNGLRIVQPMTLMAKGDYQEPKGAFLPSILY